VRKKMGDAADLLFHGILPAVSNLSEPRPEFKTAAARSLSLRP